MVLSKFSELSIHLTYENSVQSPKIWYTKGSKLAEL